MKFDFPLEVALIDDEPDLVELMVYATEEIPELHPIKFTNSIEALEQIKERQIRIVLTDIDMPRLKGDQLIMECKKLPWNIDVIVMTGLINKETALKCFDAGAREILIKPVDIMTVKESLEKIIERYRIWHQTLDDTGISYSDRTVLHMDDGEEI